MSNQKFVKPRTASEALLILGISPHQSPTITLISKQYRLLAKKYHPDANPDSKEEALVKFLEISYAYEILTNAKFRLDEEKGGTRDLNVVANVAIRFEDGFFGKSMRLFVNFTDPLYKEERVASDGLLVDASTTLTPLILDIPAGTVQTEFVFSGKGLTNNGVTGDLQVNIKAQNHPVYTMDGRGNVQSVVKIPLRMMLQGGELEVQTMYGLKKIVIPAGTQPKDKIQLKNLGPAKQGHHYVIVEPEFASKEELKTHDAWKKLDIHWDLKPEEVDEELEGFRSFFSSNYED